MASAASTLRERVSFESNRPCRIQLDGTGQPTEQQNRAGEEEYRYFLDGHQIMWVPPHVHAAIERIGEPGAEIEITRRRAPREWDVVHLVDEPPTARPEPTPVSAPRSAQPQQPAARPASTPALPQSQAPEPPARPVAAPPQGYLNVGEPQSTAYYTCLCAAINVCANAERYAQQIGRPLAFETQDVRAIATSLYIQNHGGR